MVPAAVMARKAIASAAAPEKNNHLELSPKMKELDANSTP